jgi:predicted RecA/RadA family phage recombinase
MQAFVHHGHSLIVPAPYEVHGGDGVLIGALFGVAMSWSGAGDSVEVATTGVFDLKKDKAELWQVGDRIYWDDATRLATLRVAGNRFIGVATETSKGQDDPLGRVRITGVVA